MTLKAFPVDPSANPRFEEGWFGQHEGTDIFAPKGTKLVAVDDGRLHETTDPKGGLVVYLKTPERRYYYAHLDAYADGSTVPRSGDRQVSTGDTVGFLGNSGNAVNRPPHLHFGIYPALGGVIDPFPELVEAAGASKGKESMTTSRAGLSPWLIMALLYYLHRKRARRA